MYVYINSVYPHIINYIPFTIKFKIAYSLLCII